MPPLKKARPPLLSLETIRKSPPTNTVIELETPIDPVDDEDFSSPSSISSASPPSSSLVLDDDSDPNSDELSRDLAVLEKLRRSVHQNLRLRPIRSGAASIHALQSSSRSASPPWSDLTDAGSPSPNSSISPASVYYTPISDWRATPVSARRGSLDVKSSRVAQGIDSATLLARLSSPTRPLLIDTRPVQPFLESRLERSINIAIPSLILKRCRKPNGAFQGLDNLRQYITTEDGKQIWDDMMSSSGDWDGDVILYDEVMLEKDRQNPQSTPWALLAVISPLLHDGAADYLDGGFLAARQHPYLRQLIQQGDHHDDSAQEDSSAQKAGGLFQLNTSNVTRSRNLPEIEKPAPSPQPMMFTVLPSVSHSLSYSTPSPPPSQTGFRRPPPPRRPSIPTLSRIDTTSTERLNANLPKLQVRTVPTKSATLDAPVLPSMRARSRSPSHLTLTFSNHLPPPSSHLLAVGTNGSHELLPPPSPSFTHPSSPGTPGTPGTPMPPSPSTARPDTDQPLTTEEPFPIFTVSTILPGFLYLGPELTVEEHVEELLSLGVKRIINIAAECDDDHDLHLRERFDRYVRIPMRDTVEEDNITRGMREVCDILDDARLHSSPAYVHCKAGKSRSVTAVMAYLIHANHWTLSRAYAFVLERRKGISPNIGFVSELMTFEEHEIGGKSVGVVKMGSGDGDSEDGTNMSGNYQAALGGRRQQHMRESLPPAPNSFQLLQGQSPDDVAQLGDSGQEMEIKDATGRYRHARRAPVDEATLQPMRRVSKAGLESAVYV